MVVEGGTDRFVFEGYVERFLAPSLSEGQIVLLDNLGAQRPRGFASSSRRGGASFCSCRRTRRI